jgi:uncharacterized protein with PIN domain
MNNNPYKCFTAEQPLGKLAKWLRILGFDTIYGPAAGSADLQKADNRHRIRLTRSRQSIRQLSDKGGTSAVIQIRSDHVFEQLTEVIRALNLEERDLHLFSICIRCNSPISRVEKPHVMSKVPDYVYATQTAFRKCNRCGRIYWPGSHAGRTHEIVKKIFKTSRTGHVDTETRHRA